MNSIATENFFEIPFHPVVKFMTFFCMFMIFAAIIFAIFGPADRRPMKLLGMSVSFFIVSISAVAGGIYGYKANSGIAQWPKTEGKVIKSEMITYQERNSASRDPDATIKMFRPDVIYQYSAAGKSYQSGRIAMYRISSSDANKIRAILNAYPVGAVVQLFYNPQDPEKSVIEFDPSAPRSVLYISIGMAAGFFLFSLLAFCYYYFGWD